ncbi:hypothetical protein SDC9_164160 [bioreactor metagenome]|uniref:Uncharacterized protein n=1 Tax=bioreactor metagenome TaxID=1076179 RepID=A0A645FY31_9ZZZZ
MLRLKFQRAAVGDNTKIFFQLFLGHPDTIIGNGQGSSFLIRNNVDRVVIS